ncbi:ornithine cyclodeaminase [Dethiosulfatibacter aminovorans DSM 17477]|uniref:Ornithine cyclodeaminase n=1 Tax=Dethiosulfatibacter aminovorans DSM 17477 TaxID=1121476 RepID=A0A1M6HUH0_9FIRM|nr:ornithine cyclodeaminase family protein [Dethiosulfatibacter aminovorans]SHJ25810.1 ornithine cyclodeaminase [Dethiosulfatibacter aminovorans DSM 17477]
MEVSIFGRKDMQEILEMKEVIEGVKAVYKLKAEEETAVWPLVSYDFEEPAGVMDIKSGYIRGNINLHGAKMLNTFWGNDNVNTPIFNGLLMVFDSNTGVPLGMMDASYVTCMRTGAAGAIGVEVLARTDSRKLFILGAGKQASFQIAATLILMPGIEKVYIADALSYENAVNFADRMPEVLRKDFKILNREYVDFEAIEDMAAGVGDSDVIITITPSRSPVIKKEWLKPGTHLSCVGADMKGKVEIDPEIFTNAKIYADDKKQCMEVGEMELAVKKGIITEKKVVGEVGAVIAGLIPGRETKDEITVFDATGVALLDLVTAKIAIDLAKEKGLGRKAEI